MAAAAGGGIFSSLLILLPLLPLACSLNFTFPTFAAAAAAAASGGGPLTFEGDAGLAAGGVINLTSALANSGGSSFGRAVLATPVPVWDPASSDVTNFTATFTFALGDAAADGFAFFLGPYQPSVTPGEGSEYIALFNGSSIDTLQPDKIIAVELDQLGSGGRNGSSAPAVDVNNFSVTTVTENTNFTAGVVGTAWIKYDSGAKNLSVKVSYPPSASGATNVTSSHIVDLREALPQDVAVGFSSAVQGASATPHSILSWNFSSTLQPPSEAGISKKRKGDIAEGIAAGLCAVVVLGAILAYLFYRRRRRRMARAVTARDGLAPDDLPFDKTTGPRSFSYAELAAATKNFADARRLGAGAFGEVYRGLLAGLRTEVAIKRISKTSRQGRKEYVAEVTIISRLRHRNLVQLIGYCHEKGDLLLVYEYMPNGSLDTHLARGEGLSVLGWPERHRIVAGLASALLYMHEECEQMVVHRDIKPSNIMLDADFTPKLGDFGLAKLVDHERGALTTGLAGTRGYMAPECMTSGRARKESDIYSFGVVTLQMATGRSPWWSGGELDAGEGLVRWAWELYGQGRGLDAAAAAAGVELQDDGDEGRLERMMAVGLWCAHPDMTQRPSIRQVINVLSMDAPLPELPASMPVAVYQQPPPPPPPPQDSASGSHGGGDAGGRDSSGGITLTTLNGR